MIEVRPATREDVEAIAAFEREGMRVLLCSVSGEAVGFLAALLGERAERDSTHARRILFVDTIAVKESAQRHGCGKALIDAARGFFAAQGFGPMFRRLTRPVT